ncbi:MAG: bifunctional riboflavin kinase/FAD synthetase [Rickettsiales bacterium]
MQLIRTLPERFDHATAVAIGNFDGVHRGHGAVLAAMLEASQAAGLVPSVLTFEPHPRRLFAPQAAMFRLEPLANKLRRLRAAGVARVYMPRFTARFAQITAEAFMHDVLGQSLGAKVVVTGENFAFGHGRGGNVALLRQWGTAQDVRIITVPPLRVAGAPCSSSAIRAVLAAGDVATAGDMLGRHYCIAGRVRHGDGRGAGLGFATANLALPPACKVPAYGVYAVRARLGSHIMDGVANLGVRPSVHANATANLEVHLFDMNAMLYGERMEVDFYAQLRGEQKFASLAELTAQIARDCDAAKAVLAARV